MALNTSDSEMFTTDAKTPNDVNKQICRGCLCSNRAMNNINETQYKQYLSELTNMNISDTDELPPWLCWECEAQLQKYSKFRHKILQCHNILLQHLASSKSFSTESVETDLSNHAAPKLSPTQVLKLHCSGKQGRKSCEVFAGHPPLVVQKPKSEPPDDSDYEDDLPLQEFKYELDIEVDKKYLLDPEESVKKEEEPFLEIEKVSNTRRSKRLTSPGLFDGDDISEVKKRKKKTKNREKFKDRETISEDDKPKSRAPRKIIEVDPYKIRVIRLSPQEQEEQRKLDAENGAYLKFPFKCTMCYKGFNYEQKLNNHMLKHSKKRGDFECSLCHMFLPTIYSFNVHEQTHSTRYECLKCGKKMIDKMSIMEHYAVAHEGYVLRYTCHLCNKVSLNSKTHRGHMRNHHSGERPRCDRCGKTFVNKDSLNEHILIHTGVKNHECEVCGKRFRTKTQVKHHLLKHSDARDFYCVECDMSFKSAHNLKQHLLKSKKHVDVDMLKHGCDRCDRRFASPKALEHHVQFGHLGRRLHVCAVCGASLATRNSLAKHARTAHEGYRAPLKHTCTTCGKAFRGKNVLINHMRVHTGEKPYECPDCGRNFSQRTAMRTHVKLVHLKKKWSSVTNVEKSNTTEDVQKSPDQVVNLKKEVPKTPQEVKKDEKNTNSTPLSLIFEPSWPRRPEEITLTLTNISIENIYFPTANTGNN